MRRDLSLTLLILGCVFDALCLVCHYHQDKHEKSQQIKEHAERRILASQRKAQPHRSTYDSQKSSGRAGLNQLRKSFQGNSVVRRSPLQDRASHQGKGTIAKPDSNSRSRDGGDRQQLAVQYMQKARITTRYILPELRKCMVASRIQLPTAWGQRTAMAGIKLGPISLASTMGRWATWRMGGQCWVEKSITQTETQTQQAEATKGAGACRKRGRQNCTSSRAAAASTKSQSYSQPESWPWRGQGTRRRRLCFVHEAAAAIKRRVTLGLARA